MTTEQATAPATALHHGGILVPGAIVTPAGVRYALVVAPKALGEAEGKWSTGRSKLIEGAGSYWDGLANTNAMAEAGSKLAKWARALEINGHSDWYLPSRDELELLYRHLKPTARENYCYFRSGDNPSSAPAGYPYTAQAPAQTASEEFRAGGAEAFEPVWYWSSTQYSADLAWDQTFDYGHQDNDGKCYEARARAVRRFLLA